MPQVKFIEKKDISEPVLTIVRLLKEKPERFRFSVEHLDHYDSFIRVKDLFNGRELDAYRAVGGINFLLGETAWMTIDEKKLLADTIMQIHTCNVDYERKQKAEQERLGWLLDYQDY